MNHTVLARKWRPKKFADLIGQQSTVTILQNIITTNRLHHAYLLTGTRGVGKTTIARIIAKALNCLNPVENEPCGNCDNCKQIDLGRFIDVIEIDAASNTGVDNIREVLENAQYTPTSGKYKIYIIDEVHMLSKSAFNAMLKTLEEPPAHIVFILATTDPHKVPITILSRCLQLKLRNLSVPEIQQHLAWVLNQENINSNDKALELIATAANGSMRDALSLTDQAIAFSKENITHETVQDMLGISDDGSIIKILDAISNSDTVELVKTCQQLNNEGRNLEHILQQINYSLFQISLAQLTPQPELNQELLTLAQKISLQDCQLYFEISNLGLEQLGKSANKYSIYVMCLLRMIAFTIGSSQEKQIIVNGNNLTSKVLETSSSEKISIVKDVKSTAETTASTEPKSIELNEEQSPVSDISPQIIKITEALEEQPEQIRVIPFISEQKNDSTALKSLAPWEDELVPINKVASKAKGLEKSLSNLSKVDLSVNSVKENQIEKTDLQETGVELQVSLPQNLPEETPIAAKEQFDGNWINFVSSIDNNIIKDKGLLVVLRNSQLESMQDTQLSLTINDSFRVLVTPACVDSIELLLSDKYGNHFDLEFNFSANTESSLKNYEINQAKEKQANAEQSINNDPIIQDLISNFSAKIIPNSIKPLD